MIIILVLHDANKPKLPATFYVFWMFVKWKHLKTKEAFQPIGMRNISNTYYGTYSQIPLLLIQINHSNIVMEKVSLNICLYFDKTIYYLH